MLTAMTEEDWTIVLRVFAPSRSRRGDKGRNDRKFLEALHYFVVHNITWRALPEKFGHWNSVWKRFWRLSRSGTFEAFFDALAAMSETAHLVQMFRFHRGARPCLGSGRKRGQHDQALGRSRGGFSTKIHLRTDFGGLPIAFHLTGGEASDSATLRRFSTSVLISIRAPHSVTKATIPNSNRDAAARLRNIVRRSRIDPTPGICTPFFPKAPYKARARIELAANTVPIIEVERTQRQCCIAALEVAGQLASPFGRHLEPENVRSPERLQSPDAGAPSRSLVWRQKQCS